MSDYEIGKDIQRILNRLEALEASTAAKKSSSLDVDTSNNPLFGVTWGLDGGKSKFLSDFVPSDETRIYEEIAEGYRLTVTGVHDGKPYSWGYSALYDGKPHAVWGRKDADAIVAYKVTDRVTLGFFQKGNALASGGAYARIVSEDGKSLQVVTSGVNADGAAYYNTIQYTIQ